GVMTTAIDHHQLTIDIENLKTQGSRRNKRHFVLRFDPTDVKQLSADERSEILRLGHQSDAFRPCCEVQWGATALKANPLALTLVGVLDDLGKRVTSSEPASLEAKRAIFEWIHSGDASMDGTLALEVLPWCKRHEASQLAKSVRAVAERCLERDVDKVAQNEATRRTALNLLAENGLPSNRLTRTLLSYEPLSFGTVKSSNGHRDLTLSGSQFRGHAQRVLQWLSGILENLFIEGDWKGSHIQALLESMSASGRAAIRRIRFGHNTLLQVDQLAAILDLLPQLSSLDLSKSKVCDNPDLWKVLCVHGAGIRQLHVTGAAGLKLRKRLGLSSRESCSFPDGLSKKERRSLRDRLLHGRPKFFYTNLPIGCQAEFLTHTHPGGPGRRDAILGEILRLRTATKALEAASRPIDQAIQEALEACRIPVLPSGVLDHDTVEVFRSLFFASSKKKEKGLCLKGDWSDERDTLNAIDLPTPQLTKLELREFSIDDSSLEVLRYTFAQVTKLKIKEWNRNEEQLLSILSLCSRLRDLELKNSTAIGPRIYDAIHAHCPQLRKVKVSDCPQLESSSAWNVLGLPRRVESPITVAAKDPFCIHRLFSLIQSGDPWVTTHAPLVRELVDSIPVQAVLRHFLPDPQKSVETIHTLCRNLDKIECYTTSAIMANLSLLPCIAIQAPLSEELLEWLSNSSGSLSTLRIRHAKEEDIALLRRYPLSCGTLILEDTVMKEEDVRPLLKGSYTRIESKGPTFWHRPWPSLPPQLDALNLLEAVKGPFAAEYGCHVALSILLHPDTIEWDLLSPYYKFALFQALNPEATEQAFTLMSPDQKIKAWGRIRQLNWDSHRLLREILVSAKSNRGGTRLTYLGLISLSPSIEAELRDHPRAWVPAVQITDEALNDLKPFLSYGVVPEDKSRLVELFEFGHSYAIDALIQACEQKLCTLCFDTKDEAVLIGLSNRHPMPIYEARRAARIDTLYS
ncbi:MAG: leucine-rich repeat domain-containing protein, partial [Chlamydiia bacterium]|nr:leucine-rich repeat domain-containing protein [Chlamydiia bacterium]